MARPLHSVGDLPVSNEHHTYLADHGFTDATIAASGVYSVLDDNGLPDDAPGYWHRFLPALVFTWTSPSGIAVPQLRPDDPPPNRHTGKLAKYLFPKGTSIGLGVTRGLDGANRTLIVEGTKQGWVAATFAPDDTAVFAVAGVQNWMRDGAPTGDFAVVDGTDVVICLDVDAGENFEVYRAGIELRKACTTYGAASVSFVQLPGGSKAGLDDVLAQAEPDRRTGMLARLMATALADKPAPVKPKRTQVGDDEAGSPYFAEGGGLLAHTLASDVLAGNPGAISQERTLALYRGGVYRVEQAAFGSAVAALLGDDHRPSHRMAAFEVAYAILDRNDRVLPEHAAEPLLNCPNGMVDLQTGQLHEHHADYLSAVQIAVPYDPGATCPTYAAWIEQYAPGQVDDLEEVAATMLDPTRTPPKAIFLFGPTRSGKSTFLRIMAAIAGPRNTSAVELGELCDSPFAAARVFGKVLNTAADLPARHVEDLSMFKKLTGEDLISANRKYGGQFEFTNRALFAFSANEVPTVGETSRAYSQRIKPFRFPNSFAGAEDPAIEEAIMGELPGILSRWVTALRRLRGRGQYAPSDPAVEREFENRSDRVRMWLHERCDVWTTERLAEARAELPGEAVPVQHGAELPPWCVSTKRDLARAFNKWAERATGGSIGMGERKIIDRLTSIDGVYEVRDGQTRRRGLNVTVRPDGDDDDDGAGSFDGVAGSFRAVSNAKVPASRPAKTSLPGSSGKHSPISRVGKFALPEMDSVRPVSARNGPILPKLPETARDPVGAETPIVFDLETRDAAKLFAREPGFVRLAGYTDPTDPETVTITHRGERMVRTIESSEAPIVGHNVLGFDLLALARHHGLDLATLAESGRITDTRLLAQLDDPPWSGKYKRNRRGHYSLDAVAERYGVAGKTDDLTALAKQHGGFDAIPTDDPAFRAYLEGDVRAAAALAKTLPMTDYARREHHVVARLARTTVTGFRVDTGLLEQRLTQGREHRARLLERLHDVYGLPLHDGKGRELRAPQATDAGKAAIDAAFRGLRIKLPRTETGKPDCSKTTLAKLAHRFGDRDGVRELCELVSGLNGIRTVYGTVADHLVGDRVHPTVWPGQASGRWSVTGPGLTVLGKREGRHVERAIFLPDAGDVLLAADLDQVDMRAVAALSGDREYAKLFAPGADAHAEIARRVFGDPSRREAAKAVGHGWNYGRSARSMIENDGIDPELAMTFCREMAEQFPDVVAWQREVRARAEATELLDNGFGRSMRCDAREAHTEAPALCGQGAARDLLVAGILRLPLELVGMIRTIVHDELIFSVPPDAVPEVSDAIRDALSFEWRGVPITAGVSSPGPNWAALYDK